MDILALRVRDRFLIRRTVRASYTAEVRTASWAPPQELVVALAEGLWDTRLGSTDREAALGIVKAVKKLLGMLRRSPKRVWEAISRALGLENLAEMGIFQKAKAIASRAKKLISDGRKWLGKAFNQIRHIFPLNLYFMPKKKAPGITDLLARIAKKSPKVWAMLKRVKGGLDVADKWLKDHLPNMRRVALGAIFALVWFNVAELSWDIEGLIAGFSGGISLADLLASLPESALGLLAAGFGLGYGALPVTLAIRIVWLVSNDYLEWTGRNLRIKWEAMGVPEPDEAVAVA
jgi:hypothetical protein